MRLSRAPFRAPAFPALRVAGRPVRVSLTIARRYGIPCGLSVQRARSGCPSGILACPLRVCALALPRRPRPSLLPGSVWRAHLAWFRCRAPVGPFNEVHSTPCFLPRSRALSGLLRGGGGGGGGGPAPFPPIPGSRLCAPLWAGLGGWGGGGGGLCAAPPRGRGRGVLRGGGLLYPGPSLCLPWAGTKAGGIGVAQLMEGVVSILFRFVSAC